MASPGGRPTAPRSSKPKAHARGWSSRPQTKKQGCLLHAPMTALLAAGPSNLPLYSQHAHLLAVALGTPVHLRFRIFEQNADRELRVTANQANTNTPPTRKKHTAVDRPRCCLPGTSSGSFRHHQPYPASASTYERVGTKIIMPTAAAAAAAEGETICFPTDVSYMTRPISSVGCTARA